MISTRSVFVQFIYTSFTGNGKFKPSMKNCDNYNQPIINSFELWLT